MNDELKKLADEWIDRAKFARALSRQAVSERDLESDKLLSGRIVAYETCAAELRALLK